MVMLETCHPAPVACTTALLPGSPEARIVHALRRILRQVELGSKKLEAAHGVTAPQPLSLLVICEQGCAPEGPLRQSLLRAALMLNTLLRDKHEGLNRGNADPPTAW